MTSDNASAAYMIEKYNADYLRDFWERRREAIEASGDPIRLKLLKEHDERAALMALTQEKAA